MMFSAKTSGVGERGEASSTSTVVPRCEVQRRRVAARVAQHRVGDGAEDHDRQQQRHRRAGGGDAELLARRLAVAVGAHEAAEEEQLDAADADALTARGERVPELVGDDRPEEQRAPR